MNHSPHPVTSAQKLLASAERVGNTLLDPAVLFIALLFTTKELLPFFSLFNSHPSIPAAPSCWW
ncbi:MAG: hypothetical protein NWQ24_06585 [Haliea sp.]|nr:hypothetical protein [Haliea sp.]